MADDMYDLIYDSLCQPVPAIGYYLDRALHRLFPDRAVYQGVMQFFDLEGFAAAGLCEVSDRDVPHSYRLNHWQPEVGEISRPQDVLIDVRWEGEDITVLIAHWQDFNSPYHYAIIAQTMETARQFHDAVCAWATRSPTEYILVFDVNGWNRDDHLLAAIKGATLDAVVLHGTLKEEIVGDITSFFAAQELYAEYGVPWKRGILFVGPPGNGKTLLTKSIVNVAEQKCIYVKTFSAGGPDQMGIRAIFEKARELAPCLLVLEDLDSLITPNNRSYFLNELDGFAGNEGVLTLATTNHPERLDPAILDRPSRFDRKYPFPLPEREERLAYIANWNQTLRPALQLSPEGIDRVADATEDFSFAYLKELFLSALMRWITLQETGAMDTVMAEQIDLLRDQMVYITEPANDLPAGAPGMRFGRRRGPVFHDGPAHHEFPM
jgi:AAA+ superfamily predicted ATPase